MKYNISFDVCGILILLIIAGHFFNSRRLGLARDRFFGAFVIICTANIFFDIVTAFTIYWAQSLPLWLNMLLNSVYYALQTALPPMFGIYVLLVTGRFGRKTCAMFVIPSAIAMLMLIPNLFVPIYFKFENGFIHAPGYYPLLALFAADMLATMAIILKYSGRLRHDRAVTMLFIIPVTLIASFLQLLMPSQLLCGISTAVAIAMMYLTLQNPADMTDEESGALSRRAFVITQEEGGINRACCNLILAKLTNLPFVHIALGDGAMVDAAGGFCRYLSSLPQRPRVFRLRPDTVAALFSSGSDCSAAAVRLRERLSHSFRIGGADIMLSVACCIAEDADLSGGGDDFAGLLDQAAELASDGDGGMQRIGREFAGRIERRRGIARAITGSEGTLLVRYIPVMSLPERRIVSAEAEISLQHPELGLIRSEELLSCAEKTGTAAMIGSRAFARVCAMIRDNGLDRAGSTENILINISPQQLLRDDFAKYAMKTAKEYGVRTDFIIFQTTGQTSGVSAQNAARNSAEIRAAGFGLCMDATDTRMTILSDLFERPYSRIKLGRRFFGMAAERNNGGRVAVHIAAVFDGFGCESCVADVESEEELELARRAGIGFAQGRYISEPVPEEDFPKFIRMQGLL